MTREEAIRWLTNEKWKNANNKYKKEWNEAFDMAIEALSAEADAEPMTEEVREALMRLTMCAREECDMCKYKEKCGFEFQYNISTENMHTILDALLSAKISQDIGKYENAMQKFQEMPKYLNGIKEKQIKKISTEAEWIPCGERLPDIKEHHVSGTCLVYFENGAYGFAELEENIFGQVGWNCGREDEYHEPLGEVIAWMPLPKPYKGGDDE